MGFELLVFVVNVVSSYFAVDLDLFICSSFGFCAVVGFEDRDLGLRDGDGEEVLNGW
jgi:hypothetical protein